MNAPIILIIGSRTDRAASSQAGIFAGNAYEETPRTSGQCQDAEKVDQELVERFSRFCAARMMRCVWLRRMQDAHITVDYTVSGPALTLGGLAQDAIKAMWYRGLPIVPAFATEDDQAYAERETEAFWEGYCDHAPLPILNRLRTLGLRPALWESFLVRHMVKTALDLPVPREGLAAPSSLPHENGDRHFADSEPVPVFSGDALYQTLSTQRRLRSDEMATCREHCTWVDVPAQMSAAVLTIHVGTQVMFARPVTDGTTVPLEPSALPATLAAALTEATRAVARLLNEEFGVTRWDVDVKEERFVFRDFTPNPDGRTLADLEAQLFPLIWHSLTLGDAEVGPVCRTGPGALGDQGPARQAGPTGGEA